MKRGLSITLLVIAVFFLFIFLVGGFLYFQLTSEPSVPENVFLSLDLNQTLVENEPSPMVKGFSITDLWLHIRRAERDSRVKGLLLNIERLDGNSAVFEEIGGMLKHFKEKSGKPVVAFLIDGGLRDLYLASFADKVFVFRGNDLFLTGLAGQALFIKKTLEILGIESEFYQIGAYKTAANTYTQTEMTPEHRESYQRYFSDLHRSMIETIAANRGVATPQVDQVIQDSPMDNESYREAGLLDGSCYPDQVLESAGFADTKTFPMETYAKTSAPKAFPGKEIIAVLFAEGEIHSGQSGQGGLFGDKILGADTVVAQLRSLRKNPRVKAVVFRINSPGGSALASDLIYREAELLAKEKPLVISMGGMAASGGYWISMPARHIVCNRLTVTGSIGVLFGKFNMKGFYNKIGITKETIKTSPYADIFSDYRSFTPEESIRISGMMSKLYGQFVDKVAASRKMSFQEVDQVAQGRIWAGSSALELKLVDELGGLWQALDAAAGFAGLDPEQAGVITYPRKKDLFDFILETLTSQGATMEAGIKGLEKQFSVYRNSFFPAYRMSCRLEIE